MQNRHLLFIRLLSSPTLSSFFNQEPLVPSVLPTGDASTVPRGGQRPCQIIGVEARSEGAILGDVAATPKMAGLAYEVSCIMCWVPVLMVVAGGRKVCVCACVWGCWGMGKQGRLSHSLPSHIWPLSFPLFYLLLQLISSKGVMWGGGQWRRVVMVGGVGGGCKQN